jgi:hypothetical protein
MGYLKPVDKITDWRESKVRFANRRSDVRVDLFLKMVYKLRAEKKKTVLKAQPSYSLPR